MDEAPGGSNFRGFFKKDGPFDRLAKEAVDPSNLRGVVNEINLADTLNKVGHTNIEFLGQVKTVRTSADVDVKSVFGGRTFFADSKSSLYSPLTEDAKRQADRLLKVSVDSSAQPRWVIKDTSNIDQSALDFLKNKCEGNTCIEVVDFNGNPL